MPDTRKPRSNPHIIGTAWILRGEITTNLLNNDPGQASMAGNADFDAVQNKKSQTEAALGPKFENLLQKMRLNVGYFVCFCNLVNILHAGPAATQVKIQIQGFLQLRKATTLTALKKLMSAPVYAFLSGEWARCEGGL
jgi:hypothetical protein